MKEAVSEDCAFALTDTLAKQKNREYTKAKPNREDDNEWNG